MSGLGFFRRNFTIRRFGEEKIIDGYGYAQYEDMTVSLNVQPLSHVELQALPEGERQTRRLKAYGDFAFRTADQNTGIRGDWLLYYGKWYECVSSVGWDHTILSHCKSEFVAVPESETSHDYVKPDDDDEGCRCYDNI